LNVIKPYRFIPEHEIERSANDILRLMQQTRNYTLKWPLDASRVAEFLGLDVVWDRIPPDNQGLIAARILPLERLIEINENILELPEGFEASTVAHEIGHWVLHINSEEVTKFLKQLEQGIKTTVDPFLCVVLKVNTELNGKLNILLVV
jgi:Zn-dependent peptidase ImmA (M78 family)